jgi:beta-lactamase regulating signal transducer with metallopeptidase domain
METALRMGLTNIAVAALIALVAAGASLIRSRPALAHALWLLVILKLLTPPLWGVDVHWPTARAIEPPAQLSRATETQMTPAFAPGPIAKFLPEIGKTGAMPDEPKLEYEYPPVGTTMPPTPAVTPTNPLRPRGLNAAALARWLPVVAMLLWLLGSMTCAAVILLRVARFHRLLRFATLASPALQGRASALARRMGMAHAPRVWLVPGAVSPMLWPLGRRPRVLIPSELWDRIGEGERSSLLAHELAHLRRRDHWVRLPEVLASVLYWWCPLMWYARRRLRESEEQCCDAWVVWAIPDGARDYASALLETVDFVSASGRAPLPVLASGMGQFHQLRRRLVMIKNSGVSRNLSSPGWLAVGALALGLLPLAPTLAQVSAPVTTPPVSASSAAPDAVPVAPAAPVSLEIAPVVAAEAPAVPIAIGAAPALTPPAAPETGEDAIVNDLKTKNAKPRKSGGSNAVPDYPGGDPTLDKARQEARNEVHDLSVKLKMAEQRLKDLEMAAAKQMKDEAATGLPGTTRLDVFPTPKPLPPGYYPQASGYDRGQNNSYAPGTGGPMGIGKMPSGDYSASRERRLDAIEANLKALLDEVHSMREKPSSNTAPRGRELAK